jgi:hypothetical protein
MCVQQSNGSCAPVADIVYVNGKPTVIPVPGQHITRGMAAFFLFRCPTCAFPNVDDPRRSPSPAAIVGVNLPSTNPNSEDEKKARDCKSFVELHGAPAFEVRNCYISACMASLDGLSITDIVKENICIARWEKLAPRIGSEVWRERTRELPKIPARQTDFWDSPAGRFLVYGAEGVAIGLGLAGLVACAASVVCGGAVLATGVIVGISLDGSGGAIVGKSYEAIAQQACQPHVEALLARTVPPGRLDAADMSVLKGFVLESCALNVPNLDGIRAMQRRLYQDCEQRSRYAQPVNGAPQIVAASRRLNECLRGQAVQAAEKGLQPREAGTRFADQWSVLLRSCSASSGLQWRGDLQNGAAWPVGAPAGDPMTALSGCVVAGIR